MTAKAVHALTGEKKRIEIKPVTEKAERSEPIPLEKKSRFGSKLVRGEAVSSVEIVPPRSSDLSTMLRRARACHLAGVDAINIPDGPRASARISPMVAAITIRREVGIEPIRFIPVSAREGDMVVDRGDNLDWYEGPVVAKALDDLDKVV